MGMTLKELLTKGEGTLSAQEAKALAAQCRMDVDTLYTLLEERGIKVLEEENEPSLDVDSIIAEVENAENNSDELGLGMEDEEEAAEENPADLKAAMEELEENGFRFRIVTENFLQGLIDMAHRCPQVFPAMGRHED